MNTPPQIDYLLVLAGVWVLFIGLYLSLGVFLPKYRARHGRSNNLGPELTASEQAWQAASFIGAGVFAIIYALH